MYARALFEAAQEAPDGSTASAASLAAIAAAVEEVPELGGFLRNPQIDPPEKASVLAEVAAGADELVNNFVRLVAQKGRAGELLR